MPADPAPAPLPPLQSAPTPNSMNHPDGMIEIALPGGVSVRVDAQVDSGALHWPMTSTGAIALSAGQLSTLLEGCEWRATARNLRPELAG